MAAGGKSDDDDRSAAPQAHYLAAAMPESDAPSLDPVTQAKLGEIFRSYCDDLISQPVPDDILVLLAQLEAKERSFK